MLAYPYPRIIKDDRGAYRVLFGDNGIGKFRDCRNGQGAYGGTWTENIVSGISRDILVAAMFRLEAAGYPITLHVHDELLRGAKRLRQRGGIRRSDDPHARLGAGPADRGRAPGAVRGIANERGDRERRQTPRRRCRPVGAADRARTMVRVALDAGRGRQDAAVLRHGERAGSPRQRCDPRTWCDFNDAFTAAKARNVDGIAFVLTPADPFIAISLDNCRHPRSRSIDIWAQNFLDVAHKSRAEATPLGDGITIWGLTTETPPRRLEVRVRD